VHVVIPPIPGLDSIMTFLQFMGAWNSTHSFFFSFTCRGKERKGGGGGGGGSGGSSSSSSSSSGGGGGKLSEGFQISIVSLYLLAG
jgi:hypothetical protein